MTPSNPIETVLFVARLRPHRSLSRAQSRVLIGFFAFICAAVAVLFYHIGAWPVSGFLGLDVVLLALAFRASFRSARACEDVRVSPIELQLAKVSARGRRREWRFNPAWVRLERDEHVEFGLQSLALRSRGERVSVASFLGADEKARFADDLSAALAQARRGAHFS